MLRCKAILVLGLALATLGNAFNPTIPLGKEAIFDYKAVMRSGTEIPTSYGSVFMLEGKLHVQVKDKDVFYKLSDLHYKIYNGPVDYVHEYEAHDVPLPEEVSDLMKVFKVTYDERGLVSAIYTGANEKEYVRNMKRSIASLWQVDAEKLKESKKPFAFVTEENSIYGHHEVKYDVVPHGDVVRVSKLHSVPLYYPFTSNQNLLPVEKHFQMPRSQLALHEYVFVKEGDNYMVKRVEGEGEIHYHPLDNGKNTDSQYVYVNQTYQYVESHAIEHQFTVENEHKIDIVYHYADEETHGAVIDVTNGRTVPTWDKVIPKVHTMMKEVWEYLQVNHIKNEKPDYEKGQLINRLVRLMQTFDHGKIEELLTVVSQDTSPEGVKALEVFHNVLPLVGTEASTILIKKLVVEKKVNDHIASKMLRKMPRNVIMPTRQLVTQMEDIIRHHDKLAWNVHTAAVLSFASLVHRAYSRELHMHRHVYRSIVDEMRSSYSFPQKTQTSVVINTNPGDAKNVHIAVTPEHHEHHHVDSYHHVDYDNYYDKYVEEYINQIRNNEDKSKQMLYLTGLRNMKMHSILTKHFVEAVNGVWWQENEHMRFLSMWVMQPLVHDFPKQTYELFWPIMVDRQEPTILRMFAYYLIMESHPSQSTIFHIHWQMMKEMDHDIYHFHYTYMTAVMHSHEPSMELFKQKVKHVMRYVTPPLHGLSIYKVIDFKDLAFDFGGAMHTVFMEDHHDKYFAIYDRSFIGSKAVENYHVSVKVHGVEGRIADMFHINTDPASKGALFNIDEITQKFSDLPEHAHVEIIISEYQEVFSYFYIDASTIKKDVPLLRGTIESLLQHANDYMTINYDEYLQVVMVTDIGIPTLVEHLNPSVNRMKWQVTFSDANKVNQMQISTKYVRWSNSRQGLTFYNPILDVWQGVNKYIAIDYVWPLSFSVSANPNAVKISFDIHREEGEHIVAGLRFHSTSMVFVKDDHHRNLLSSSGSQNWAVVSRGEEYRHNSTNDVKFQHSYQFFDVEGEIFDSTMNEVIHHVMNPHQKYFEDPFDHYILYSENLKKMFEISPYAGSYGLTMIFKPFAEQDVTNVDLTMRFTKEFGEHTHVYAPASKYSARVTYSLKNGQQVLKTWDIDGHVEMNDGHTVNDFKMEVTRIVTGTKNFKICVDGTKKYSFDSITGHVKVIMGQTADEKCPADGAVVNIEMKAEPSAHQVNGHYSYGACDYYVPYTPNNIHHHHTMDCMAEYASLHKYVYDITTSNVPSEFVHLATTWWDILKGIQLSRYQIHPEHGVTLNEHQTKIEVVYAMDGEHMDINLYRPQKVYSITGVPVSYDYWAWFDVYPESPTYSTLHYLAHAADLIDHCDVHHDYVVHGHDHVEHHVPNDWHLYVGDVAENPKHAVYVKHVEPHKMAVKVVNKEHVMEVVPHEGTYIFKKDGQTVNMEKHKYAEDWIQMFIIEEEALHPVIIHVPHFGFNIEYHRDNVYITLPKFDHPVHGQCYVH